MHILMLPERRQKFHLRHTGLTTLPLLLRFRSMVAFDNAGLCNAITLGFSFGLTAVGLSAKHSETGLPVLPGSRYAARG